MKASEQALKIATSEPPEEEKPEPIIIQAPAPVAVVAAPVASAPAAPPPPPPRRRAREARRQGRRQVALVEELQKTSEMPGMIFMDGKNYKLADKIEMLVKADEADHKFVMENTKDTWSTNQEFKYPDQKTVKAKGRAHVGGSASGTSRTSSRAGTWSSESASTTPTAASSRASRSTAQGRRLEDRGPGPQGALEELALKVPGNFVKGSSVSVKQESLEAEREVNMFGLWCYQALE